MKNKKKVLLGLTACCALLCSAAAFAGCHEHVWDAGTVTTPATCTEDGVKTFKCDCGEEKTEPVSALDHSWDNGEVTSPSGCETDGVKTFTCTRSDCGETKTEPIGMKGHKFDGEWVVTKPAADAEGKAVKTCSATDCEAKQEETLPKLTDKGYKITDDTADCEQAGTGTYSITVNGTPFSFSAATPKKEHVEQWVLTRDPSKTIAGSAKKACKNCTYDFGTTEELPVLTQESVDAGFYLRSTVRPTCTENGKFTYTLTTAKANELFGGEKFKSFEVTEDTALEATGHDYETQKTGGAAGQAVLRCKNDGCRDSQVYSWEKPLPAGGTSRREPVQIQPGKYNYVATSLKTQYYKFKITEAALYRVKFDYIAEPEQGVAAYIPAVGVGSSGVVSGNKVASSIGYVALKYKDVEGVPATPIQYAVSSMTLDFTANFNDFKDKDVIIGITVNAGTDVVVNFDIPDDNTPEPLPKLEAKANTINFAEAHVTYNYEFTSATAKKYSITVPAGVSAGLERADGAYEELLDGEGTVNFEMKANETVTFLLASLTTGSATVTIGEPVVEPSNKLTNANVKGNPLNVDIIAQSVVAIKLSDDFTAGKYLIAFNGAFVTSKSVDRGYCWFQLNGSSDYTSVTNSENGILMASAVNYKRELNGWSFNPAELDESSGFNEQTREELKNAWKMTLDLKAGDIIYLAPQKGVMPAGTKIDVLNLTLYSVNP